MFSGSGYAKGLYSKLYNQKGKYPEVENPRWRPLTLYIYNKKYLEISLSICLYAR